jgi:hypothetical protein
MIQELKANVLHLTNLQGNEFRHELSLTLVGGVAGDLQGLKVSSRGDWALGSFEGVCCRQEFDSASDGQPVRVLLGTGPGTQTVYPQKDSLQAGEPVVRSTKTPRSVGVHLVLATVTTSVLHMLRRERVMFAQGEVAIANCGDDEAKRDQCIPALALPAGLNNTDPVSVSTTCFQTGDGELLDAFTLLTEIEVRVYTVATPSQAYIRVVSAETNGRQRVTGSHWPAVMDQRIRHRPRL